MIFENRKVDYPNRVKLKQIREEADGIVYDIERSEGNIINAGTPLNAQNLNGAFKNLEDKITQNGSFVGQIIIFDYTGLSVSEEKKFDSAEKMKNFFGGTWQAYAPGRVLAGIDSSQTEFNTIGKEGGAKTHTLTESEMPKHSHSINYSVVSGSNYQARIYNSSIAYYDSINSETIGYNGYNIAHNNLQPYKVVYMWRRIS